MTTCIFIERVAGDYGPDIFTRLKNVDLTPFIGVSVNVRLEQGGELNKDAVIDDAAEGRFHIVWDPTDLVEGIHYLRYVLTTSAGKTSTPAKPAVLLVHPQL